MLSGQEVKSVRAGAVSLKASYATTVLTKVMSLLNASISPYPSAGPLPSLRPHTFTATPPHKERALPSHGKTPTKGLTLVPLKIYTVRSLIKLELGLGRGKKQFEKRELLKKRDVEREMRQHLEAIMGMLGFDRENQENDSARRECAVISLKPSAQNFNCQHVGKRRRASFRSSGRCGSLTRQPPSAARRS